MRQNRAGRTLTSNQDTPTPLQRGERNHEEGQRLYIGSGPVSRFERDISSLSRPTSQENMSTWAMRDNVPRDPWFTRKDQPLPPLPVDPYTSQPSGLVPEPRRRGNFTLPRRNLDTVREQSMMNLSQPSPRSHIAHMSTLPSGTFLSQGDSSTTYHPDREVGAGVGPTRLGLGEHREAGQLVTADAERPREPSGFSSPSSIFLPQHTIPPKHRKFSHLENPSTEELESHIITTRESAAPRGQHHHKYSTYPNTSFQYADYPASNPFSPPSSPSSHNHHNQGTGLTRRPPAPSNREGATKPALSSTTETGHHNPAAIPAPSTRRLNFARLPRVRTAGGGPRLVVYDPDPSSSNSRRYPPVDPTIDLAAHLLPDSPVGHNGCFRLVSRAPLASRWDALVIRDFSLPPGRDSVPSLGGASSSSSETGSQGPGIYPVNTAEARAQAGRAVAQAQRQKQQQNEGAGRVLRRLRGAVVVPSGVLEATADLGKLVGGSSRSPASS
ncbi:hypothetical protein F5X96DRAFT_586700 [Biscogniauxia mediterranea]|nr:hypothetical protein F5X96DRAFT_586700 [Biscogniauxia mediterranea]